MLKYLCRWIRVFKRKSLMFKASIVVLIAILLTGSSLTYAQLVDNSVYRIAVDQRGNMRLLDPDLNGDFNDELKKNEFMIELPSDMRVSELASALEEQMTDLGEDISDINSLIAILESTVEELGGKISGIEELVWLSGEDIDSLEEKSDNITADISDLQTEISGIKDTLNNQQNLIDELSDSIDDLQEQIDAIEQQEGDGNNSPDTDYIPLDSLVFAERPYFGETAPINLEDMSENGYHGTCTNVTDVQLPSGLWVRSFNGSSSYIDISGLTMDLSGSGDFTVMGWFKADNATQRYGMSQSHTTSPYSSDWIVMLNQSSYLFWMRSKGIAAPGGFDGTAWNLLVLDWDLSEARYEGFVNGVSVGTSAVVSGYGGTGSVKIGTRGDAKSSFFGGDIALPKIYNCALTPAQIQAIYQAESNWLEP